MKSDYNWWENIATNYNVAPNNYVNKWYYLNMTAEDGIATLSLNNLYTQYNTIQKDNNCKLPNLDFTLMGVNATFLQDSVVVNNSSNVKYNQYKEFGSLTASFLTSSITINVYKDINQDNIHINVTHGQKNVIMIIKLPEDISRNITVIIDGIVYNVTVYEGIGVLTINKTIFENDNKSSSIINNTITNNTINNNTGTNTSTINNTNTDTTNMSNNNTRTNKPATASKLATKITAKKKIKIKDKKN